MALKEGNVWKLTEKGCALLALHESGLLPEPEDGELYSAETEAQIERFWKLFTGYRNEANKADIRNLLEREARGERVFPPKKPEPKPPKRWTKRDTIELIVSIVVSVATSVIVSLKLPR